MASSASNRMANYILCLLILIYFLKCIRHPDLNIVQRKLLIVMLVIVEHKILRIWHIFPADLPFFYLVDVLVIIWILYPLEF